jgi:BirA family transcriptional regulator, biotin operon repressor / biotin---[acetyl-CoA-carboxylase] ligase
MLNSERFDARTHQFRNRMDTATNLSSSFNPPPLSVRAIESWLADAGASECAVETVEETGSTNADLMSRAREEQFSQPVLRAAEYQYEGRGRQGRPWLALPRHALLFSLGMPLKELPASLPAMTLAAGVALAECLQQRGVAVQLKWPNDLRVDGRKLGGILSELAVDGEARYTLVVGIGINLHLADGARTAIGQPAVALDDLLPAQVVASEREAWIGRLAAAVLKTLDVFSEEGFAAFRPRFNALMEGRGREVDILDNGRALLSGRLTEVDNYGRLVIDAGGGAPRAISVGDVAFRDALP